ncbi:platelet-activating factor acetylhydrolase 2, cytoplasmic isoform 2-T3 [Theristicus caerulescens]
MGVTTRPASACRLGCGSMGGTQSLALPLGKGPHLVGCTDVMVGHTRQGLFLRLFYPCLPRAGAERPLWIPRYEYCGGLADFAHRSRRWCAPLLSVTVGKGAASIPSPILGAPPSPGHPLPQRGSRTPSPSHPCSGELGGRDGAEQGLAAAAAPRSSTLVPSPASSWGFLFPAGSCRVPVSWNGPFKPCSSGYPLIIFSHGLGAFRTLYSSVCSELASWGFAVAALEHRDRSASMTYFCTAEAGREEWIPYRRVPQGQKEFYFRNKQVHQRAEECVRALRLFADIGSGKSVPNVLHQDFDLSVLKDSVDLTKVAVMGHSFGGVTAVLALVKEPSFRCAVALDAWMFPLENALYSAVPKPVLFINTEKFQTPESVAKMKRLSSRNSQTKIITILGSVHQSQTDFTFLTGKLISRILGMRGALDPHKALDITSRAALAFLQRHLNLEEELDQWDNLLEGVGDSVVPEAPFCRSNL